MKRCTPCKLNETREESEREKNSANNPGSISCIAVFIMANHVKWCCRGQHLCKLNRAQVSEVLSGWRSISWLKKTENCIKRKVSSESMDFSDLMGKINCWLLHRWPRMEREREGDWSSNNFTKSEGSVVYRHKNWFLRLRQLLRSFVFIYMDF